MLKFASFEREVLRALFETGDWVDAFSFHEKYRLSPGQLAFFIQKLTDLNLLEVDGLQLRLNQKGIFWTIANRDAIFMQNDRRRWIIPRHPIETPISPSEPYLPVLRQLDSDFFLKQ